MFFEYLSDRDFAQIYFLGLWVVKFKGKKPSIMVGFRKTIIYDTTMRES